MSTWKLHVVELLVQAVVKKIKDIDSTLNLTKELGGSVKEGTKLGLPDKYDVYLYIGGLRGKCQVDSEEFDVQDKYGRVTLKLKS